MAEGDVIKPEWIIEQYEQDFIESTPEEKARVRAFWFRTLLSWARAMARRQRSLRMN